MLAAPPTASHSGKNGARARHAFRFAKRMDYAASPRSRPMPSAAAWDARPRKWGRARLRNAAFCRQIGYDGIPKAAAAADEGAKKQEFFGEYIRPFRRLPH